jgi:hypothetical protein
MTTTNKTPTIFKIVIPDELGATARVIVERGDLSVLLSFEVDDLALPAAYETMITGMTQLSDLEQNPPADIQIPEPVKPAPARTPQKPATTKLAASKPAPKAKWWVNEDTGKVTRDDKAESKSGHLGPFDTEATANDNVPDWLKPMDTKKKAKR